MMMMMMMKRDNLKSKVSVTFVKVTITGTPLVSNWTNSSSLTSTSGCSLDEGSAHTWTLGIHVLLKAAWNNNAKMQSAL